MVTAQATGTDQISLAWTESSSAVTGFLVQRSTDGTTFTTVAGTSRRTCARIWIRSTP